MIRLRRFIILGLLAVAGWLIGANDRALGVDKVALAPAARGPIPVARRRERGNGLAEHILLAALVGISIVALWIWITWRAIG